MNEDFRETFESKINHRITSLYETIDLIKERCYFLYREIADFDFKYNHFYVGDTWNGMYAHFFADEFNKSNIDEILKHGFVANYTKDGWFNFKKDVSFYEEDNSKKKLTIDLGINVSGSCEFEYKEIKTETTQTISEPVGYCKELINYFDNLIKED